MHALPVFSADSNDVSSGAHSRRSRENSRFNLSSFFLSRGGAADRINTSSSSQGHVATSRDHDATINAESSFASSAAPTGIRDSDVGAFRPSYLHDMRTAGGDHTVLGIRDTGSEDGASSSGAASVTSPLHLGRSIQDSLSSTSAAQVTADAVTVVEGGITLAPSSFDQNSVWLESSAWGERWADVASLQGYGEEDTLSECPWQHRDSPVLFVVLTFNMLQSG